MFFSIIPSLKRGVLHEKDKPNVKRNTEKTEGENGASRATKPRWITDVWRGILTDVLVGVES